ncbi:MAG TPA: hypothetical protein H9903_10080 [Candidatus Aquabacterium excrementipullorum]|nr:hypothetical protein [Candidatus Aquabacterium excrementipullorum]
MTAAYDLFVRELGATGREYGDGFSFIDPLLLTPDEHAKVRDALRACIGRQEARAPKTLAVIDSGPDTVALLQTLFRASQGAAAAPSEFEIAVADALVYLVDTPEALDLLERTAMGDGGMWITGAAMEGLITAHERSNASARLARLVRTQQDEALALLDDLMSGDAALRDAALLKVLKAPVHHWPWID